LLELQEWNVKKVQQSDFTVTKLNKSNITCFKCQQLGHYANDPACPACNSPSDQQAWKRVKPTNGEPLTKVVSGRTLYWCTECNMWVIHKVHLPKAEFEAQRAIQRAIQRASQAPTNDMTQASNPTVTEGATATANNDTPPLVHFTLGQQTVAASCFNQFRDFL